MEKINKMNWQYLVVQRDLTETPINDLESIMIGKAMRAIKKNSASPKLLVLVSIDMTVNLYSSVIFKFPKLKCLKKAVSNDRFERARPEKTEKSSASSLILNENKIDGTKSSFAVEIGAYG